MKSPIERKFECQLSNHCKFCEFIFQQAVLIMTPKNQPEFHQARFQLTMRINEGSGYNEGIFHTFSVHLTEHFSTVLRFLEIKYFLQFWREWTQQINKKSLCLPDPIRRISSKDIQCYYKIWWSTPWRWCCTPWQAAFWTTDPHKMLFEFGCLCCSPLSTGKIWTS